MPKTGGNLIVTMGNPVVELLVHKVLYWYDRMLGTTFAMDTEEAWTLRSNTIHEVRRSRNGCDAPGSGTSRKNSFSRNGG